MTDEEVQKVNHDKLLDELADLCIDMFLQKLHSGDIVKENSPDKAVGFFNGHPGHQADKPGEFNRGGHLKIWMR
ncbi:MAG: hypothetical protein UX78_C0007G0032 [Candidatus Amesbacteria bacterium GW2011_GWA2_47_11]|uniref:Uncharacterized protein n=1 Tax=Candidatus Amesbacteria bacterium GW2011_GWA2_47_11 TaxID=1618357 RepID=A0A0G1RH74_9BACT|nr:MAG: hypothetical protein UX78_C0007G0032 [Candidatus Amesbacteria bacterium GW2011_GWA2_47_11]